MPPLKCPETNIFAPENGWLEYDCFLLGVFLFSGALAVGCQVFLGSYSKHQKNEDSKSSKYSPKDGLEDDFPFPGGPYSQVPCYIKVKIDGTDTKR